ncbi:CheR family methyltransferase [Dyadobacter psychrotolerans]|uniref:PAS domain S-box protein n=1 Tax=Dyadobacter psychrotolerans TaxID=2541721 RepID=A0A4R5DTD1_9BACT|nr:CheR family methyltransferase [Dyadobacter psychrotolerans]TDE15351.1 PAS domain S-box protein [Dyadobacter psychrotolerans]
MSKQEKVLKELPVSNVPVPIVAIGASAGGLEAVTEILENLSPSTGMAFVYIQHLPIQHESQLSAILGRVTEMPVTEAAHLMPVTANHVYIIPPNQDIEVENGTLTLTVRPAKPHIHLPIDQFFLSLSERQKDGAIAVLLSGTGQDGTLGLKAIKVAGGITLGQDQSALHRGMVQSAIEEGVVDMVLSPKEIATELERLGSKKEIFLQTAEPEDPEQDDSSDEDLRSILQYLKTAIGVDFDHYKVTTIRRRVIRRMLLYKLETLKDYIKYIKLNPGEANILYSDLLINVTNFFRDSLTMDYVKTELFPQIIKKKTSRDPIRIWIAGCSTGQEAYSLAMILLEVLGERVSSFPIQIFASDLSESAIAKARLGLYVKSEVTDVSPVRMERFFTQTDGHYRINKSVRDLCIFAPHNLLRDPPFSRLDMISCRNLLIYLDSSLQQKVMTTFHYALNPDGILLLGKSEAASGSPSLFSQIEKNHKVFSKRNVATNNTSFEIRPRYMGSTPAERRGFKSNESKNMPVTPLNELDKMVDTLLLSRYVPASVVVDQELEILQFRGATSLFLEPSPGKPSFNLVKMARPSLVFELRNIIHKANKSGATVRKNGLEVKIKDQLYQVEIEAVPLFAPNDQRLFLILFEEVTHLKVSEQESSSVRDHRIKELEAELSALREDMHSILEEQEAGNEELQSANEEILSSNEELQSINEELETSKEEIESANEELLTINQELQVRNDQLTEAYGYSEAILATICEATLILDKDLRIKSANKAFYNIFRINESETEGRMLYELDNRQWDMPELISMLENVIRRDVNIKAFEVKLIFPGIGEKVMLLHARKVVQQQRQEAILLVIEDITEHRKAQSLLQERKAWFEDMINSAPALIWVAESDGKVNFFNKAWLEFTGHAMDQQKSLGAAQGLHPDDHVDYMNIFNANFIKRQPFTIEYRLMRSDGAFRWMMENAKPRFNSLGEFTGYIGTCTEVHMQKTLTQQLNLHVEQRTSELKEANKELERTNQELRRTARRLQAVLDSFPGAIGFIQETGQAENEVENFSLVVCNLKYAETFNKPVDQIVGKYIKDLYPENFLQKIRLVVQTGDSLYEENKEADGKSIGISITKHETGVVITALDITVLKDAENQHSLWMQELVDSNLMLQSIESMKDYIRKRGEFLRSTSHDLRGSFGVIMGATALLDVVDTDEDRARTLSMIQRNLRQVASMMNQLLDFSRLETGQETFEIAPFDAAEMLSGLCKSTLPMAADKGLWLRFEGPLNLPVQGDSVKIHRIAQNLLINSIKYIQQGGVSVNWGLEPVSEQDETTARWQFTIKDTGDGISQQLIDKLSDQGGNDLQDSGPETIQLEKDIIMPKLFSGEGIGLFIVKRLCMLIEAKLEITSNAEQGTTFKIILPQTY